MTGMRFNRHRMAGTSLQVVPVLSVKAIRFGLSNWDLRSAVEEEAVLGLPVASAKASPDLSIKEGVFVERKFPIIIRELGVQKTKGFADRDWDTQF